MKRRLANVFVVAAVMPLTAAGCGGTKVPTAHSGAGRLLVTQIIDRTGPMPIEGASSYLRIEKEGAEIVDERLQTDRTTIRLEPGTYQLISYQRTCDGNCGYLDQPSDRCDDMF